MTAMRLPGELDVAGPGEQPATKSTSASPSGGSFLGPTIMDIDADAGRLVSGGSDPAARTPGGRRCLEVRPTGYTTRRSRNPTRRSSIAFEPSESLEKRARQQTQGAPYFLKAYGLRPRGARSRAS